MQAAILCLLAVTTPVLPVKEPAYQRQPRYALLAFGESTGKRVWLAHDGDTLYLDRNGNGDLTEAGEAVAGKADRDAGTVSFECGDVSDGPLTHTGLSVHAYLAGEAAVRAYSVRIDAERPGLRGLGRGGRVEEFAAGPDNADVFDFGETPQTAPVVRFAGPLSLHPRADTRLTAGREATVYLTLGTAGVRATTRLAYETVVPEEVRPKIEVGFTPARPGEPPVKDLYEVRERC